MTKNVNQKGDIGMAEAIRGLTKAGYVCFVPMSDKTPIDLIASDTAGICKRIQVKYRELKNGRIVITMASVVNGKKVPIDRSMIDGFVIYCPDVERVLFVPASAIDPKKGSLTIRFHEAKYKGPTAVVNCDQFTMAEAIWRIR